MSSAIFPYFVTTFLFIFFMNCENTPESPSSSPVETHQQAYIFVGTYTKKEGHVDGKGKGIYLVDHAEANRFKQSSLTNGLINPSFLSLSKKQNFLYAVSETGPDMGEAGAVAAYAIDPQTKQLTFINKQSSHSYAPCHITVDSKNQLAFVANYVGGKVAVYPIREDGALEAASQVVQLYGKSPEQKPEDSHPHSVILSPDERFAYVPDLGADKIWIFSIDYTNGQLMPAETPFVELPTGAGPRHFTFHPNGKWAYVINELNNTITRFDFAAETGSLALIVHRPTLPEDFTGKSFTADIHISPDGRFLYGSNRGHDSIACFAINQSDGSLSLIEHEPTRGSFPRNFMIAPDGKKLYVANQNSDNVTIFNIEENGALSYLIQFEIPTPVCLKMVSNL